MKKVLISLLVILTACSSDTIVESSVAPETSTTTSTASTTSTTTTQPVETTMLKQNTFIGPKVSINNCPNIDISDETFELIWDVEAGSGDIVEITILLEKNGINETNIYFTKEYNDDIITFPKADSSGTFSYILDNTDNTEQSDYIIEISVLSEQDNGDLIFAYDLCFIYYKPTPTTTTTSSTTTTTIPYESLVEKCFLVEEVNIRMPQLVELTYLSNANITFSDKATFRYKLLPGSNKISQILIRYQDNFGNSGTQVRLIDSSSEGLALEGNIITDPLEAGFQSGFSYGISSLNIIDDKGNEIHYLNLGQITNRVNRYWCELNHTFFTTEMIFKIDN